MAKQYDIVIIGAGPAGLAAGLYGGRAKMNTLIIEKEKDGGQIVITSEIENYPGSIEEESGVTLIERMAKQADKFGCDKVYDTVEEVDFSGDLKVVKCKKETYEAKAVIIAAGASPRKIGCPGEAEFTGKGVSYCATCDAAFFEDFEVYVVGGGDAAVEEAMYLTKFARKVHQVVRRDVLRAAASIQEKAFANPKMDFMWNSSIVEITGDGLVNHMVVKNNKTGELTEINADEEDGMFGIFVFIGFDPATKLFEGKVDMEKGYIKTDDQMRTNVPGVYAAGDCRVKELRQVVTAAADGAIAAWQAARYIDDLNAPKAEPVQEVKKEKKEMLEVDKNTFEEEVLKADGYVLVDYFGDGCVPCAALMPHVHEIADKYGDQMKFCSLNTTKARRLAIGQKVLGLPTITIYKDGAKVEELVKEDATAEAVLAMVEKYVTKK